MISRLFSKKSIEKIFKKPVYIFQKILFKDHAMQYALENRISDLENELAITKRLASIGQITGKVAHDLNNIFTGIGTYPEVLMMDENLGPEVINGLEMIKDSGQHASAVVRDLLTICQGVVAEKEPVDINMVLENYISSHDFEKIKQNHNTVKIEINKDSGPLYINGSYLHLEKIILNLFLFAAQEAAQKIDSRIRIKTAVKILLESSVHKYGGDMIQGEYIALSVAFNSCSLTENLIPDKKNIKPLFEPFFIKKKMGKNGTGLELTLVWNAVQDHNGHIHIEHNENETCFELLFPAGRTQ